MSMGREVSLVIKMIYKEQSLPEALKNKALESLRVLEMTYEEGDAEQVLLNMIIKAIEDEDKEALNDVADLIGGSLLDDDSDDDYPNISDSLEAYAIKAANKFFEEKDRGIRLAILERLLEEASMFPLLYENGNLLFYCHSTKGLVYSSVNKERDIHELVDDFSNIDHDTMVDILNHIHELTDNHTSKVRFTYLDYKILGEKQFLLKLEEA